jgi:polyisoprenoid-binding protein YceI
MSTLKIPRTLALAGTMLVAVVALAADANINAGKSSLVATFKQEGVPVDTPFRKFSGNIIYDVAKPAAATAALDVDMSSLDIGDDAYNAEVRKKAWFDSATYKTATFRSTAIKAGAAGQFVATGNLTIKGRVLAITIPISVQTAAGLTTFGGSYALSRKSFGIGDPIWEDVLDDKVTVTFKIVTAAKK